MASFFFSPKGRMTVSRHVALVMNSLNILAPALLLIAVILALLSKFGNYSSTFEQLLTKYSVILVVVSIVIRIAWGITIRIIQKQNKKV